MVQQVNLAEIKLFYLGSMRDITVYTAGADGKYAKVGFYPAAKSDYVRYGVKEKVLKLSRTAENIIRIKLEFAALDSAKPLFEAGKMPSFMRFARGMNKLPLTRANIILAEIELWDK